KRAYCLKTQPATGETYPKSDLFNKAVGSLTAVLIGAPWVLMTPLSDKLIAFFDRYLPSRISAK
ncbi:hypothetical protein PO524_18515, partial [Klebsiella pneumoniae]